MTDHDLALVEALDKQNMLLERIARDSKASRDLLTQFVNYNTQAESEIPEKIRRFVTYFHDIHDVKYMYEELGIVPPDYLIYEVKRCDDRFRHLLEDLHTDLGAFEKIRQEMSSRHGNRWDHTKSLPRSNE
jgi:hypothetical protein